MWLKRSNNCRESHEGVGEDEPRLTHHTSGQLLVAGERCVSTAKGHLPDMTATLAHADSAAATSRTRCVLSISSMPRHLRLRVEGLMYEHLSEPSSVPSLVSVWDVPWFTRWRREPARDGAVSCREVIEASEEEIATFRSALTELAQTFRFDARVA